MMILHDGYEVRRNAVTGRWDVCLAGDARRSTLYSLDTENDAEVLAGALADRDDERGELDDDEGGG